MSDEFNPAQKQVVEAMNDWLKPGMTQKALAIYLHGPHVICKKMCTEEDLCKFINDSAIVFMNVLNKFAKERMIAEGRLPPDGEESCPNRN